MKTLFSIMLAAMFCSLTLTGTANAQRYWNTAFKGSSSGYLAVVPAPALANISSDFTLECWFNSTSGTTATLFGKSGFRLTVEEISGKLRGRLQTNNNTKLRSSVTGAMLPNTWYHLAFAFDSSAQTGAFFINGNYDTSTVLNGADPLPGTDTMLIGTSIYGTGTVMVDEIRIWNTALSANDISRKLGASFIGENAANNLVFACSFDNAVTGPFNGTQFFSQSTIHYRGTGEAVHLGKNPSMTIAPNSALYLDGANDYARMPTNPDIEFTGAMTAELWIYPDSLNQQFTYIISKKTNHNSTNGWGIYYDSGLVRFVFNSGLPHIQNFVPAGKWSHIAITKPNGNGLKFYLNGNLVGSNSLAPPPNASNDTLLIGKNPGSNTTFGGYIDAVKLSNYEKTADEIKRSVYEMTDNSNDPEPPNRTVAINFDHESATTSYQSFHGTNYVLMNGAAITRPLVNTFQVPVSPVLGTTIPNFPDGYSLKYSGNRIPEANTAGSMRTDSLYLGNNPNISDINVFLSLNHFANNELKVMLYSPAGDSLDLWYNMYSIGGRHHLITVFDDQADSMIAPNKYLDFGPRIKPTTSLNSKFGGENPNGWWKLKITDYSNGNTGWLYGWGVQINNQVLVGVENNISNEIPGEYKLEQNYPNPFNPATTINYQLTMPNIVKLKVYDINGKLVKVLVNEKKPAGKYSITFDGSNLASGVYFYKLEAEAFTDVKKMILIK